MYFFGCNSSADCKTRVFLSLHKERGQPVSLDTTDTRKWADCFPLDDFFKEKKNQQTSIFDTQGNVLWEIHAFMFLSNKSK
jgi:hypothetical protein